MKTKFATILLGAVTGATIIAGHAKAEPKLDQKCYKYNTYPLALPIEQLCDDKTAGPYTS